MDVIFSFIFTGAFITNGTIQSLFETIGWRMTFRYLAAILAGAVPFTAIFYRNGSSALAKPALVQIFPEQKQIPAKDWTENQNSIHCNDNPSFEFDEPVQQDSTCPKLETVDRANSDDKIVTDAIVDKNSRLKHGGEEKSEKVKKRKNEEKPSKQRKKLMEFLKQIDTWFLALCEFIMFSAIIIYYVNFVSIHLEQMKFLEER